MRCVVCGPLGASAFGPLLPFPLGAFIDVFLTALRAGSRPGGRVTFICWSK